jgi:hypothetical protein
MSFSSWLRTLRPHCARTGRLTRPQTPRCRGPRLSVEQLEDRLVPSNFSAASVSNLIADINASNRAGGTNTITLTAPTNSPYSVTAVDNTTDGATGLPVIAAGDNLTIFGNGDTIARSTAAGTPAFRLLDAAGKGSLTLENVTLQGGLAFGAGVSAEGGAIYNQGTLFLNGVTVQNNIAQGQNGGFAQKGQSASGGGIYSSGSLTLEGGTSIQNNQAVGGRGGIIVRPGFGSSGEFGGNGLGGGVNVAAGTAILNDVTLASNTARGGQGGNGNTITGVTGPLRGGGLGGNGFGGALDVSGGTVTLTQTTMAANNAAGGLAGIFNGYTGKGEGGGLYIDPSASVDLDAFTVANILNNTASTSDPNIHGSYSLLP